jgi:hypothetical protein
MCCFLKRPPFYIYTYVGENPSLLVKPDVEDHYFRWWWNGTKSPDFVTKDRFEGKELE